MQQHIYHGNALPFCQQYTVAMEPTRPAPCGLAVELSKCYAAEPKKWEIEQIQHRLNLVNIWTSSSPNRFHGCAILEIGCGQGDVTIALAHAVGSHGRVIAIDPAPLDYGSPTTLGEAQAFISSSRVERVVKWVQRDPIEYLSEGNWGAVDFIVLAHSLFISPRRTIRFRF